MLQNKCLFNQSSVSLEIMGLPDLSNDEDNDFISIISQWKLLIIDKPLIEGSVEHLKSIMEAFHCYSLNLLNNDNAYYESKLIEIKSENLFTHNILLRSSKPNTKPLNIKIGNAVLCDIVNCFDQLRSSNKVKKIYSQEVPLITTQNSYDKFNKNKIIRFFLPPLISLCSLFIVSTSFIYFYENFKSKDNNSLIDIKSRLSGNKSLTAIL